VASHEDLGVVLIQGTLVVAHSGHILDDDSVIRVLPLLIQHAVCLNHIINNGRLGDLLGAELPLRAQVLAIIVAKVVVARNGRQLDTGVDQEVDQGRLHLGLAGLEVVAADEGVVPLGEGDGTGHEGVLRGAVDEGGVLEDAGNGEDGGGRDLFVAGFDGREEVVGSVVYAGDEIGVPLGVGGP